MVPTEQREAVAAEEHSEMPQTPIERLLAGPSVVRVDPSAADIFETEEESGAAQAGASGSTETEEESGAVQAGAWGSTETEEESGAEVGVPLPESSGGAVGEVALAGDSVGSTPSPTGAREFAVTARSGRGLGANGSVVPETRRFNASSSCRSSSVNQLELKPVRGQRGRPQAFSSGISTNGEHQE